MTETQAANDVPEKPQIKLEPGKAAMLKELFRVCMLSATDLMTSMPDGANHAPLAVLLNVVADLAGAFYGADAVNLFDDMAAAARLRASPFTMMTKQALHERRAQLIKAVIEGPGNVQNDSGQIFVPKSHWKR